MSIGGRIKQMVRNFLEIEEPQGMSVQIEQLMDEEAEIFKNEIWYRGDSNELEQLYLQLSDRLANRHFWGSKPTKGMNIRKIHLGLPSTIVDVYADIISDDLLKIGLNDRQELWDSIAEENNFKDLLKSSLVDVMVGGDGAYKVSFDPKISKLPIIEFFPASRVKYVTKRGRLIEITFISRKYVNNMEYEFREHYRNDSISYSLWHNNDQVDMSEIEEFKDYVNPVIIPDNFMFAIPLMFKKSKKYKDRGKSLFDGKHDAFDSLDEAYSQWMLALRKSQPKTYIPETLLPRDPKTGALQEYNEFDNDYVMIEGSVTEGSADKVSVEQGEFVADSYERTYCTALDAALMGLISPSTIGIDVKKLDNAEAQREKEKVTLYRRNQMVDSLITFIPKLVEMVIHAYDSYYNIVFDKKKFECTVTFGGYNNPSFEAQVETIAKAKTGGIMSVRAAVEELYGDDKSEDWIDEEVERIRTEQGIIGMDEPAVNEDGGLMLF